MWERQYVYECKHGLCGHTDSRWLITTCHTYSTVCLPKWNQERFGDEIRRSMSGHSEVAKGNSCNGQCLGPFLQLTLRLEHRGVVNNWMSTTVAMGRTLNGQHNYGKKWTIKVMQSQIKVSLMCHFMIFPPLFKSGRLRLCLRTFLCYMISLY